MIDYLWLLFALNVFISCDDTVFSSFLFSISHSPLLCEKSTLRVNLNSPRLHRVLFFSFSSLHHSLSLPLPPPFLSLFCRTVVPFQTARRSSCFSLLAIVVISQSSWEVVNCRQPSQTGPVTHHPHMLPTSHNVQPLPSHWPCWCLLWPMDPSQPAYVAYVKLFE